MKGKIKVKRLTKSFYHTKHDFDTKLGGEFWFYLVPFQGENNEVFFYVMKENNETFIEGEAYIIDNKEALRKHKFNDKKYFAGKTLYYYFVDNNYNIISKELVKVI